MIAYRRNTATGHRQMPTCAVPALGLARCRWTARSRVLLWCRSVLGSTGASQPASSEQRTTAGQRWCLAFASPPYLDLCFCNCFPTPTIDAHAPDYSLLALQVYCSKLFLQTTGFTHDFPHDFSQICHHPLDSPSYAAILPSRTTRPQQTLSWVAHDLSDPFRRSDIQTDICAA